MQEGISPSDQLRLAAFVFPIVALVVNFAINSVQDEDEWLYRLFIAAFGLTALAPALIVLGLVVLGSWFKVTIPDVFSYLFISLVSVMVLSIGVLVIEVVRGMDNEEADVWKLMAGMALVVVLLGLLLLTQF